MHNLSLWIRLVLVYSKRLIFYLLMIRIYHWFQYISRNVHQQILRFISMFFIEFLEVYWFFITKLKNQFTASLHIKLTFCTLTREFTLKEIPYFLTLKTQSFCYQIIKYKIDKFFESERYFYKFINWDKCIYI